MKKSLVKVFLMFGLLILSGCSTNQLSQTEEMQSDRDLAKLALDSGRPDSAISIYRKQLDLHPNDTDLLLAIGTAYNKMSEFDLALHYLNQAQALVLIETNKSSVIRGQILRERGNAQQGLGNLEGAILDLKKAVELLPNDAKALNSLGINYALFKDYPQARVAFTGALANAPDNLEYRNNLALAWILDGQPQQGIGVLYSHYLRGSSTSKSRQNLALAFAMKGDVEAAETIAKQDLTKAELENNLAYYQQLYQGQSQQGSLLTEQVKQ
ncbi:tetratricopeptide repeat protein [Moritella dasanensis]|uniref:tetratricopeptide repeat protein n=1 Tax=Moritella dasanensis TaxID=428031 RepID=UPI0002F40E7D|nr:tetratricopeptide repeat protein [Moritella dasanensis]